MCPGSSQARAAARAHRAARPLVVRPVWILMAAGVWHACAQGMLSWPLQKLCAFGWAVCGRGAYVISMLEWDAHVPLDASI